MEHLNKLYIEDDGEKAVIKIDDKELKGVVNYEIQKDAEVPQLINLTLRMLVVAENINIKNRTNNSSTE